MAAMMQPLLHPRAECFTSGGFAMSPSAATKKACKPCRERHLKCDRTVPICSTCQKSRYLQECTYDATEIRFRTSLVPLPTPSEQRQDGHSRPRQSPEPAERDPEELAETTQLTESPASQSSRTPGGFEATQLGYPLGGSPSTPASHTTPPTRREHFGLLPQTVSSAPEAFVTQTSVTGVLDQNTPSTVHLTDGSSPSFTAPPSGLSHLIGDSTEARIFKFYLNNAGTWVGALAALEYHTIVP